MRCFLSYFFIYLIPKSSTTRVNFVGLSSWCHYKAIGCPSYLYVGIIIVAGKLCHIVIINNFFRDQFRMYPYVFWVLKFGVEVNFANVGYHKG